MPDVARDGAAVAGRPFFTRLEALRGLGAVAVAAYHFMGYTWIPGRTALMVFWIISGFVLRTSLAYGPQAIAPAAVRFAIARIFRIYPIVVFSALMFALTISPSPFGGSDGRTPLEAFLRFATLLDVKPNGSLWALQVEVLAAPIIVGLYFVELRFGVRYLGAFALLATALSFSKSWAIWPPLSNNLFAVVQRHSQTEQITEQSVAQFIEQGYHFLLQS